MPTARNRKCASAKARPTRSAGLSNWRAGFFRSAVTKTVEEISHRGGTPLVVASDMLTLGTIELKDVVKGGIKERFAHLRKMGIKTVMITGDNPLTAAAIAAEAGVDDFMAQATPEEKLKRIRQEQAEGHLVAMTGDGTNDAPALAQADVGVAMNTGTQAAREAGNMVDLDSNPTKLIDIVEIGKQMLITRGSLTTFSIANDVAKYFAILPAMLMATFPEIAPLNIMHLSTSTSAILQRRHFQRAHHYRAHSAGAAWRRLQTDRRARDLATQPADLRLRRSHRSVHRDQADRPDHHRASPGLTNERILLPYSRCSRIDARPGSSLLRFVSAHRVRNFAAVVSRSGERQFDYWCGRERPWL